MQKYTAKKWVMIGSLLLLIVILQSVTLPASAVAPISSPQAGGTIITVEYIGTWSTAQRAAIEYAAQIWANKITSHIPITIQVEWFSEPVTLENRVEGQATSGSSGNNTFPFPNNGYPMALVQARENEDLCHCNEIALYYNSNATNWYYGLDGNPPSNSYDFVTFTVQQIANGLGFGSTLYYHPSGIGFWGGSSNNSMYHDPHVVNGAGQQLINQSIFPNFSYVLGEQLISNNLFFNGNRAIVANGGTRPKLYAPTTWAIRSTEYLDETTFAPGTPDGLLTPVIQPGEAIHEPGPVIMAMLYDIGWPDPDIPPTFHSLPDQMLLVNTQLSHAINLWNYVTDQYPIAHSIFTIANSPDPGAGVAIRDNQYVRIYPATNWLGQTEVTIRVRNPDGSTSTDTFYVSVVDQIVPLYLPLAFRP